MPRRMFQTWRSMRASCQRKREVSRLPPQCTLNTRKDLNHEQLNNSGSNSHRAHKDIQSTIRITIFTPCLSIHRRPTLASNMNS